MLSNLKPVGVPIGFGSDNVDSVAKDTLRQNATDELDSFVDTKSNLVVHVEKTVGDFCYDVVACDRAGDHNSGACTVQLRHNCIAVA
jgi:hypothetical protein